MALLEMKEKRGLAPFMVLELTHRHKRRRCINSHIAPEGSRSTDTLLEMGRRFALGRLQILEMSRRFGSLLKR